MHTIQILPSEKAPGVAFDAQKGTIAMTGRSLLEDAQPFYAPLKQWLESYRQNPRPQTLVNLALEYFNTNSSKEIMSLLRQLEHLQAEGRSKVEVNWYYEDADVDMQETGEDFQRLFEVPMKTIAVDDPEELDLL